ncbi:ferredoxin--NADP+ reductase [Pseudomonas cuatrocienegasensis]|uniref:ferredoxin--NADP(+) reductase n=1 Tax=Pseudomonas cuatrocienegasensis TaxID=543360 RepID=A0ABY1BEV7_9PSED|nr:MULTISPECIES: ferredoxin--NADP reductase [Pseudomonas]OEC34035.1 ferredoxin--NADP(+) reductase [Pseudomonas sp. 21C1]SEQ67569.1 ferredoxin--NADP+ reductase [Pseudomonas cuatrocienegasensis]
MSDHDERATRQTVLEVTPLTPSLFTLRTTRAPGFRFRAGQFAQLGLQAADGQWIWRPYSMVSAPHDEYLEFFSIVVPDGAFTSELCRLAPGDGLWVGRQAFGYLTLERFADGRDLWLLASGTGLAPFLSLLQDFEVWQRFERIVLVYSARTVAELAYQPMIRSLAEQEHLAEFADKLIYLPVVTREPAPGCLNARITDLLDSGELERAAGLALSPEHSRLMICGNPQMIEDTRQRLKARGMQLSLSRRPGQIAVETYW